MVGFVGGRELGNGWEERGSGGKEFGNDLKRVGCGKWEKGSLVLLGEAREEEKEEDGKNPVGSCGRRRPARNESASELEVGGRMLRN